MAQHRVEQLKKVQDEARELFNRKNHDYGDAFAEYDVVGVLVRLGDKVKRCQSISKSGIQLVDGEKLRDTLIDMHNYAAMAIMLLDEIDIDNQVYDTCDEHEDLNEHLNEDLDEDLNEDLDEDLVLEDNVPQPLIHKTETGAMLRQWQIIGDSGKVYHRNQYYDTDVRRLINTCSCPSFKWNEKKVCKHITQLNHYRPMIIEEIDTTRM